MLRKISEEADWTEGDGRCPEAVRQADAGGGSYGGRRDPEAHTYRYERYVERVSYRDVIRNSPTSFRRKRNKASGPTIGKQHRRREMFVINRSRLTVVSLTFS